jgi:hypothetical protein
LEEKALQDETAGAYRNRRPVERITKPRAGTAFDPGARAIQVHYRNYRGEEKTFSGDPRTLRRRRNHLSLCVAPSGIRLALARERILNLHDLDAVLSRMPTPREQVIMAYHKKRGTTSPLLERLRAKYPDW